MRDSPWRRKANRYLLMPVKRQIPYPYGLFFITFTCYKWDHLIGLTKSYDLVYKWFDYLKQKGNYISGYVIMPNHIHALIAFRNSGKSLNKIIGDGKRFIAYGIIERLKDDNKLLLQLSEGVKQTDRQRGKLHEVWESSFDWKECLSNEMILQKLDYMHDNPCNGRWKLAESPVDYTHSSAKYYLTDEQGVYTVDNFMMLDDIDLSAGVG